MGRYFYCRYNTSRTCCQDQSYNCTCPANVACWSHKRCRHDFLAVLSQDQSTATMHGLRLGGRDCECEALSQRWR